MSRYDAGRIEPKWQEAWEAAGLFRAGHDGLRVLKGDHVEGHQSCTRAVRGGDEVGGSGERHRFVLPYGRHVNGAGADACVSSVSLKRLQRNTTISIIIQVGKLKCTTN